MNDMSTHAVMTSPQSVTSFNPVTITRPHRLLMKYYIIIALLSGPGFVIAILPLMFKYQTLKYRFDESGISMSWGILFRRETYLTYRRIQDIHLTRNIIQRWMGLATVGVQTASGNSGMEMSIEGILEAEPLRDYLYSKMRGARGENESPPVSPAEGGSPDDEALILLRDIRDSLKQLAQRGAGTDE